MFRNFRSGRRFFSGKVGSSQPPFVQYSIKVGGVFADKAAGDAYINSKLISGSITNSSFQGGLYTFETSAGAEVGADFMGSLLASGDTYEDLTGLITDYGDGAFNTSNSATIKLANGLIFANDAFRDVQNSTIEVGNFNANNTQAFGTGSSSSTWKFKGTIGSTTGLNSIFSPDLIGQTIQSTVANQTSNAGGVEGDLADLISSGATVSFVL